MKIAVVGYSGSGKSTLARRLGERSGLPVLHLDTVQFLPGWQERPEDEQFTLVQDFMDAHESWIIDGNYSHLLYEQRMDQADRILLLLFNRWSALWRVTKRYLRYRGKSRPDMTAGCEEKLDGDFVRWVLWKGRSKRQRERFALLPERYPDKCVVLKNQRQIDRSLKTWEEEEGKEI